MFEVWRRLAEGWLRGAWPSPNGFVARRKPVAEAALRFLGHRRRQSPSVVTQCTDEDESTADGLKSPPSQPRTLVGIGRRKSFRVDIRSKRFE